MSRSNILTMCKSVEKLSCPGGMTPYILHGVKQVNC